MSATIYSGKTMYIRVVDSKQKEVFVPKGYTLADINYCWKVKQDPGSGKFFFVSTGVVGKKWKLPDLSDPGVQLELRRIFHTSVSSPATPAQQGLGSASSFTPQQSPAPIPITRDGTYDPLVFQSPVVVAPAETFYHASDVHVFKYDDPEWQAEEARRLHSERLKLYDEDFKRQILEEKRLMETPQIKADLSVQSGLRQPVREAFDDADAFDFQLAMQQQKMAQADREASMRQAETQMKLERDLLQEQKLRDKQFIERLETEQLESIRDTTGRGTAPTSASVAQPRRPAEIPQREQQHRQYDYMQSSPNDPAYSSTQVRRSSPDRAEQARLTSVIETLQKLLEYERERNEKLQRQLDERDRIAMEHVLAEAEREQREIMMRVRMVEAIAAHRREDQIALDNEDRHAAAVVDHVHTRFNDAKAHANSRGQDSIPRHPLMGDDGFD